MLLLVVLGRVLDRVPNLSLLTLLEATKAMVFCLTQKVMLNSGEVLKDSNCGKRIQEMSGQGLPHMVQHLRLPLEGRAETLT